MAKADDEKLTVAQVAARLGIRPSTWRGMVARAQAPRSDGEHDARTPWWWASTVDAWAQTRRARPNRRANAA